MNKQKIVVSNRSVESVTLAKFLRKYISTQNIPNKILDDLRLAAEEAFINIVNYAFPPEEVHKVTIELSHSSNSIDITFTDTGRAFDPLTDCTARIDSGDRCKGGMGIHLIKSLTDQQEYRRIENRNIFTISKLY
jgi:anti-sigma regulatory factor (Ser/Thr protein kinase)